jgi:hypothetical protein
MTMSELRAELQRRNQDLSGSKTALELRLAQAMVIEVAGPEAAAAVGLLPQATQEQLDAAAVSRVSGGCGEMASSRWLAAQQCQARGAVCVLTRVATLTAAHSPPPTQTG